MNEIQTSNFQGLGKLASQDDIVRDNNGYTHPNLHRRVITETPDPKSGEVKPRTYKFMRQSVNQLQLMETHHYDDNNNESEIP